ncbi:DUF1800 domain-containing protein [Aquihabitans sp. G128]|uniref:DUF1800 domain-containing protein n=1 Tax=Aquihabitans sp. G128 TaxID=2849779 RepID=UPI001C22421F|nr:DUF1800 domain-containing protein [Aquihabitans sp. G128]QXC63513.1 DUF1800 domain-containing protein [Aquihabitans sp. G128]
MADFTRVDVAHLLRRAGFGGSAAEIDALMAKASWAAVVDRVLDTTANPADTIPAAIDDRADEYYPPWVAAVQYWMDRMATTPTPIVEKMTLFWHGHLVSSVDDVLARLVFRQIKTYRSLALGDVHPLLQAMAKDPAMLAYLNNRSNVAAEPNENFARELMELFTLGNAQFTEAEVIDMARAWTGHGGNDDTETYEFHPADHDDGAKTLFGITKNWDGPAAITEIVRGARQQTCARFLAAKIWSFFAYPNPAGALVDDLAAAFIASGMNVKALLRVIFLRPEFRLASTRTALVRSPVEWLVATMRATGLDAATLHPEWWLEPLGQTLYAPPNVSGWRQNGAWISTSAQWAKGSHAGWVRWKANEVGILSTTGSMTPAAAAQAAFDRFGINEPSALTRQKVEAYVAGEKAANRSWAIPPNLVTLAMLTPDFQLA